MEPGGPEKLEACASLPHGLCPLALKGESYSPVPPPSQ